MVSSLASQRPDGSHQLCASETIILVGLSVLSYVLVAFGISSASAITPQTQSHRILAKSRLTCHYAFSCVYSIGIDGRVPVCVWEQTTRGANYIPLCPARIVVGSCHV